MTTNQFRTLALALPGAVEAAHMNHPDFRVAGRIFASLHYPDERCGMVKLPPELQRRFVEEQPEAFEPCRGAWGRQGCTSVRLKEVSASRLKAALESAFSHAVTFPKTNASRTQIVRTRSAQKPKSKTSG